MAAMLGFATALLGLATAAHAGSPASRTVRTLVSGGQARFVARLPTDQRLQFNVTLALSHPDELTAFIRDVYNPSSPNFRHFVTPQEFTARFGPSETDASAVLRFANAHGLQVRGGSRQAMNLQFEGTVADIESAFRVQLNRYELPDRRRTFYSADREPSTEEPLAIWHISGLDDLEEPHPAGLHPGRAVPSPASGVTGPGGYYLSSALRTAYYGGTLTGTGQTVGLLQLTAYNPADVTQTLANSGQSSVVPINAISVGGAATTCTTNCSATQEAEVVLDIVQAAAMAPGLTAINLYVGNNPEALLAALATQVPLDLQISSSWVWQPSSPTTDDPYFQRFAAQGQSYFNASGDWANYQAYASTNPYPFLHPSDDPYVTVVGGTDVIINANGSWNSEAGWGVTCTGTKAAGSCTGSGGGYSSNGVAIPAWQSLPGVITAANGGSTTLRNVPDVAANAGYGVYLCTSTGTGGAQSCSGEGGTSAASPLWAGYMALVNQQAAANHQPPLGFLNPYFYTIGTSPSAYGSAFHDITSGSNGLPATAGFDLVTGWGTPNGTGLLNAVLATRGPFSLAAAAPIRLAGSLSGSTVLTSAGGYTTGTVSLSAANLPAGMNVSFSPTAITDGALTPVGTSTMTVTFASAPPPVTQAIPVTAALNGETATTTVTVTVDVGSLAVGTLATARSNQTQTLLPNGNVLVAGGFGASGALASAEIYNVNTGLWSAAASLNSARANHTATLLPGGLVLVAGGSGSGGVLAGAEIYDPATNTWSAAGTMTAARANHTATLLQNGQVLVVGGTPGAGQLATAETYNPATNTWTGAGTLADARQLHTATLLPSGGVLVVGGEGLPGYLSSAELFSPTNNTWSGAGNLSAGLIGHTATLLANGQVLVAGGATSAGASVASAALYSPANNTWTTIASLTGARGNHSATLLPSGIVLVLGGLSGTTTYVNAAESFDPATNTWSGAGSLLTGRVGHSATLLASGSVLVGGGTGQAGRLAAVELYDPASNLWSTTGSLQTARWSHSSTPLQNGLVLVAGGANASGPLATAELFNPNTNAWSSAGSLASARYLHTATLLANGSVLVTGGAGAAGDLATAELYNPSTNSWSDAGALSVARYGQTATLLPGGQVLVAGGESSTATASVLATAELYSPATNAWTPTGSLNTARYLASATLLPGGQVLAAGGISAQSYTASAELYNPATGLWTPTGSLATARSDASMTLLPSGSVLVAGGDAGSAGSVAGAEIYNPATGKWSGGGTLATSRTHHTATLLSGGQVLVVGGQGLAGSTTTTLASAESYNPVTNVWSPAGSLATARAGHSASVLANGALVLAGGSGSGGYLAGAELHQTALGYPSGVQPTITAVPTSLLLGASIAITGTQLTGISEASGGNGVQNSASNTPIVVLQRVDNGQRVWPGTSAGSSTSSTSVTTASITGMAPGPAWLTVYANGVPSNAVAVTITPMQTISFPPLANTPLSAGTLVVSGSSSSGLPVTFTSLTTGVCSVAGAIVTLLATGTCTIAANQAGNAIYAPAAQATQSFLVTGSAPQSITFPAIASQPVTAGSVALNATDSAGLPISYASSTPSVCAVSGSTVTLLATGTCTIVASQGGTATYAPASVSDSFAVLLGQTITFPALPATRSVNAVLTLSATSSAGLSVSYAATPAAVCAVSASTLTAIAAGTCTVTASQAGNGTIAAATPVTQSLTITPGSPAAGGDTYSGGVLTLPTLQVGNAIFSNVVISPIAAGNIVSYAVGGPWSGATDSFDPLTGQLNIPTITVGSTRYTHVIVAVPGGASVSIGSVTGADTYDGAQLALATVEVGNTIYANVLITATPGQVVRVAGGLPTVPVDQYSIATGQLLVGAVQVGSRVYTNVTLAVGLGSVLSVGKSEPASLTIGGRVVGLASPGTLRILNGSDSLQISANGSFTLPTPVASGGGYAVSTGLSPAGQSCAVLPGTGAGVVAAANITDVIVYCTHTVSVATLNGSYASASLNINQNKDQLGSGISFDGAGNWGAAGTAIINTAGTITTSTLGSANASPYSVVTTNAIPVLTTGGNNIGAIAGADADEFFWLANIGVGQFPALAVWVNPLQNGTVASLAGDWCLVNLNAGSTPADPNGAQGFLTINADGSSSGTFTVLDATGVVTTVPLSAPAGSTTLTSGGQFGGGSGSVGYVSANGEFLFSTEIGPNAPTGLQLGVKLGANVTPATLNGVYAVGSLAYDAENIGDGRVYTMIFDGAGNWSAAIIDNNSGSLSSDTLSGTYAVTSSGVVTLSQSNGNVHFGAISADGNILLAANLTAGGAEAPRLFLGFRQ